MSFTKFDNITRSALWTSYNNICFYCTRPLEWNDLHIDHIVPESFANDLKRLEDVKTNYELVADFDINALYNLVPTHGKCNLRKGDELFVKQTTLYYLGLTNKTIPKIKIEIEKINKRKNKGLILSKLQSALSTNLIDLKELQLIIKDAQENNWNTARIKLPMGIEFIDEIYDSFYFNMDSSILYDKKLSIGGFEACIDLLNDKREEIQVSTLREWKEATKNGYYQKTNIDIKASSVFTFLDELIEALQKAKIPKVSFISEPWIELDNIDLLSPSILHDFDGELIEYNEQGLSVGDLVRKGIVNVNESGMYKISLEFGGMETSLIEQFRADFNNDGVEDIFVRGWTRAVGGTLGFGFTTILTKYSNKHLIEEVK